MELFGILHSRKVRADREAKRWTHGQAERSGPRRRRRRRRRQRGRRRRRRRGGGRDNLIPVLAYKAVQHFVKSKKTRKCHRRPGLKPRVVWWRRRCLMATPAWPTPIRELLSKLNSSRLPCSVADSALSCRWSRAAATRYTTSPRRYFARKLRGELRCGPDRSRPPRVAPE